MVEEFFERSLYWQGVYAPMIRMTTAANHFKTLFGQNEAQQSRFARDKALEKTRKNSFWRNVFPSLLRLFLFIYFSYLNLFFYLLPNFIHLSFSHSFILCEGGYSLFSFMYTRWLFVIIFLRFKGFCLLILFFFRLVSFLSVFPYLFIFLPFFLISPCRLEI